METFLTQLKKMSLCTYGRIHTTPNPLVKLTNEQGGFWEFCFIFLVFCAVTGLSIKIRDRKRFDKTKGQRHKNKLLICFPIHKWAKTKNLYLSIYNYIYIYAILKLLIELSELNFITSIAITKKLKTMLYSQIKIPFS